MSDELEQTKRGGLQNQSRVGEQTTTIADTNGNHIAWDTLETSVREIGIPATAKKYSVNARAIAARKTRYKWKGIVDARTLAKGPQGSSEQIAAANGDLSGHIPGFRARTFSKIDESIRKFRPKAPKSFRELDSAVKVGERMLGIGEDTQRQATIIQINEQIEAHEMPIEATVIESPQPCITAPPSNDAGEKGINVAHPIVSTETVHTANETVNVEPVSTSLTLNPNDKSTRRFVLPGVIKAG